jgi:hypothetical protein
MAGNANSGKAKAKDFRDMLKKRLEERAALPGIVDALITNATNGDMTAIKEVADRLDGKPAQAIIGGDEDDPPIRADLGPFKQLVEGAIARIAASGPAQNNPGSTE